ncbi:MAG: hypothetical protein CSA11_09020 [Chloroflexi bacterium]|nr:MAG: hypothetical protein CSB13_07690 [Chloroflexota bacterium]PIE80263.1 MAG: hypothetical protein CSA11_09020 [Chloroflexota bacterium]
MTTTRQRRDSNKRLTSLTEAQAAVGWSIILLLVAILGTVYLSQASQIAVAGRRVQIHQNTLDELKRENADLEKQIAEAQSLKDLQAKAYAMGFIQAQPENIEYLVIPDYPMETAVPPIPSEKLDTVEQMPPPETLEDALLLAFQASVNSLIEGNAGEQ